jgi:hypothetical protein
MTVPDVVITAENPFQGDILGRRPFAEALLSLVQRINEPLDALSSSGCASAILPGETAQGATQKGGPEAA